MSSSYNNYEANSTTHPPPQIAGQQAFPTGSKLASYLHGTRNFTRPPPMIPHSSAAQMVINNADVAAINYPLSQVTLSSEPIPDLDGSEEDRVSAFLNGDYAGSRDYFPNQSVGEALSPSMDVYHSCSAYYAYQGLPSHIWTNRIKSQQPVSPFFVNPALKAEIISRQLCLQCPSSSEEYPSVPVQVEQYFSLTPLNEHSKEPKPCTASAATSRLGSATAASSEANISTFRAFKNSDGLMYCLKRVPTPRPLSQKQLIACENWKRLCHSNVVQLKEVIQTRAFSENSFVFVYDFHPLAETLKTHYFGKGAKDQHTLLSKHMAGPNFSGLPENVIWNYIIQMSSAIRYIHSCGLAIRFLDIKKLLISGSKILIGCCGMDDVLHADNALKRTCFHVDDLRSFGMILIILAVGKLNATHQDCIASSMATIDQHVSMDLKNAIHLLYGAKSIHKVTSINEIMPMIGARFYGQIENLQLKNDFLEDELSKEVENGRLFRILCKLNIVNERPECYLLKLFRDYIFHQVTENGRPWVDFSHLSSCLNKLDAGVEESIQLNYESVWRTLGNACWITTMVLPPTNSSSQARSVRHSTSQIIHDNSKLYISPDSLLCKLLVTQ
uniref:Pan3 pseudokinase domain-containing protein n=1 Tax=Ditylenchus dipsaci TaxID=166011 RepID=A0A915DXG7_9BILA